jgi:hypothetical protein
MAWAKYLGGGLAVLVLIFAGFKAATWRADAMQLENAKIELRNQIERTVASDRDRLAVQEKLTQTQELLAKKLGTTLKAIQDHAPKSVLCDVPDDLASQLSDLRQAK